jgi:hypothetical protein
LGDPPRSRRRERQRLAPARPAATGRGRTGSNSTCARKTSMQRSSGCSDGSARRSIRGRPSRRGLPRPRGSRGQPLFCVVQDKRASRTHLHKLATATTQHPQRRRGSTRRPAAAMEGAVPRRGTRRDRSLRRSRPFARRLPSLYTSYSARRMRRAPRRARISPYGGEIGMTAGLTARRGIALGSEPTRRSTGGLSVDSRRVPRVSRLCRQGGPDR